MAKTFVAINDPVHELLRSLTRVLPLEGVQNGTDLPIVQYRFGIWDLPEGYYSLARFHALEGLSFEPAIRERWRVKPEEKSQLPQKVNYFDVIRLDRRCGRDLRLKVQKQGPGLLAAELLSFGTGTVRARNDDPTERVHQYLWRTHGRLQSRHETVYATIRALHFNSLPLWQREKESFDSTNVIYGDAYGELEQLWERRADTAFLEQVACSLQAMRRDRQIAAYLHPPLNVAGVMKLHLRCQALWKTPPTSARALLRRLDYLLANTIVDSTPQTVFRRLVTEVEPAPNSEENGSAVWDGDESGYDGWLGGE
jgi:hypothetical protein